MLLSQEGKVWMGRRSPRARAGWHMPQGGLQAGEKPLDACFRELKEETGTDRAVLLAEYGTWLTYEVPAAWRPHLWQGQYVGQSQKWFALRFTGEDSDFRIDTEHQEFHAWDWVDPAELIARAVPFKHDLYRNVLDAFGGLLNGS